MDWTINCLNLQSLKPSMTFSLLSQILRIMNEILQAQRNGNTSIIKSFVKKNEYSDVILDGLLELYDEPTAGWVKYEKHIYSN